MAAYWTVSELADYCEVSRSTIQKRANDYDWALSDTASPGKGKTRQFTPRDVAVMLEIDRQAKEGILHEQIEVSLREAVSRDDFSDVDEFPDEKEPEGTISIVEYERQMARAQTLVEKATERAEKAETGLQKAREQIAKLEGQLTELRRANRTEELMDEIIRLNREIARLEYKMKLLQDDTQETEEEEVS